jgi:uncharacterized protein (TIGR03083 family)
MATTFTDAQLVELLDEVWSSMADLGDALTEDEWKAVTECPGWTVQDNLAHVVGIESTILGRPDPEMPTPVGDHLKNDVGVRNEVWVEAWRDRPGTEVLQEFRDVARKRLAALRAPDMDFGAESWTPVGPGTVRELLPFRVFDSWVHEQDMRRAVGRLPGDDTTAGDMAFDRITAVLPMIVGKRVAPPDGTVIVFDVTGPIQRMLAIGVEGGRANVLDVAPDEPAAVLRTDSDTIVRLGTGRGDPAEILAGDAIELSGDSELGSGVAKSMNFLF